MSLAQLLSLISLLNQQLPANVTILLTEYLSVTEIKIPFSWLPAWFPKPRDWLTPFAAEEFQSRTQQVGYESISFIWNFADQLITWLLLLVIYS